MANNIFTSNLAKSKLFKTSYEQQITKCSKHSFASPLLIQEEDKNSKKNSAQRTGC
jgi:hypothetical protein